MNSLLLITFNNNFFFFYMKKKLYEREVLIDLLRDYLLLTESKQKPKFETYTIAELLKCCFLFDIKV